MFASLWLMLSKIAFQESSFADNNCISLSTAGGWGANADGCGGTCPGGNGEGPGGVGTDGAENPGSSSIPSPSSCSFPNPISGGVVAGGGMSLCLQKNILSSSPILFNLLYFYKFAH